MNSISHIRAPSKLRAVLIGPADLVAGSFPDAPKGRSDGPPATVDNVRHMLTANGIAVRYNVIKKRTEIIVPWLADTSENADAVSMTHVQSLASRYGMPTGLVPAIVEAIGDENAFNPAADWVRGEPWDGVDRLPAICATLQPREGYPVGLRDTLVRKWLLSATAAAVLPSGFRCRGVLTLQGAQGIGKTAWGLSLVDDERQRSALIKVDHHLDPANKDSQLGAIEHWIVEVGELDSSFKRDMARLKGFLTAGTDKVRKPYARVTSEYQRRTVFYATVNDSKFLVDDTGNNRWWTIPCVRIEWNHGIDMQQVFAQCAVLLGEGEIWWLTPDEEALLETQNSHHRSFSYVRDRLTAFIDPAVVDIHKCEALTASEVLEHAGFERPTNQQAKECASILREWFGESRRIQGRDRWRVPFRPEVMIEGSDDRPSGQSGERKKSKFD